MKTLPRPVLIAAGISLALALLLAFDAVPFLRGGFGWQWPYQPAPLARGLPFMVVMAVYIAGAWWLWGRTDRAAPLLAWGLLGAAVIALAVIAVRGEVLVELFVRTASGGVTGPHLAAAEIDWQGTGWYDWPAVMHSYDGRSAHLVLSPPGLPMWYALLNTFFDAVPGLAEPMQRALIGYQCSNYNLLAYTSGEWASAWFGILMPLWAALGVLPLYGVARRIYPQRARLAVMWWPLVPALVMFAPSWNTFYPVLSLLAFWLLLIGIERGAAWLVGGGLVTGLLTFANFSMVPLVLFCGVYALLHHLVNKDPARPPIRLLLVGLWFGLGLMLPWAVYWLVTRQTPPDLLRAAMSVHLDLDRPYLPWLWLHFWDWALFTGLPLILLWLLAVRQALRRRHVPVLEAALLVTMVILLLSNTARGETGRVWLFFAPFVLISAAGLPIFEADARRSWLVVTFGQAALLLALVLTWNVISADDMKPLPDPPGAVSAARPVDAAFGGLFRLASWDAVQEGAAVIVRLDWQVLRPMTTPYWFAAFLVDPDGKPASEAAVWQPLDTRYPTTCWQPGETIGDTIRLELPADAPSGSWWLSMVAFADVNNPSDSLPVTLSDGSVDVQAGLGPVVIGGS